MQYLDASGTWQDVNITTPFESSIAKNKYNRIEFDRVTTTRLRLYVTVRSGAEANGIYRFKVYSSVDVASLNEVFLATKPGVMPTLPSTLRQLPPTARSSASRYLGNPDAGHDRL